MDILVLGLGLTLFSVELTLAKFEIFPTPLTFALIIKDLTSPSAKSPIFHKPVIGLYLPLLLSDI